MFCMIISWQLYQQADELGKISHVTFEYIEHNLHSVFWVDISQLPAIAATMLLQTSFISFNRS